MLSLKVERKKKGGESGYMRKKRGKDGALKARKQMHYLARPAQLRMEKKS